MFLKPYNYNIPSSEEPVYEAARKHLLLRLLDGDTSFSCKEPDDILCLSGKLYMVLVFRLDDFYILKEKYTNGEIYSMKHTLLSEISGRMGKSLFCAGLETGTDLAILLINGNEFQTGHIRAECAQTIHFMEDTFGVKLTAALGSLVNNPVHIRESYLHARATSEYRLIMGQQRVIAYNDISDREERSLEYPYDKEQTLLRCVRQADNKGALQYLTEFIHEIQQGNAPEISLILFQLAMSLKRLSKQLNPEMNDDVLTMHEINAALNQLDTLEQKKIILKQMICAQIFAKDQIDKQKNEQIVQDVTDYIHIHYKNPDFTIDMLAEHINYSASYMRKLFHDIYGYSPTDYLFDYRLNEAKRLLRETDQTAKEIAEYVGYLNTKYFYSVFKKNTGMTTYEYREQFHG